MRSLMSLEPPFLQMLTYYLSHFALLPFDRTCGINHGQTKLINHPIIFLENPALENSEAFLRIVGPAHIQSSFVIFQIRSSGDDAIDRYIERCAEEESHGRLDRECIDFPHPFTVATTRDVTSKCGVDIAIGKNDGPVFE